MALKAGKRDTVRTVAKRYGLSVAQVASWNKVGTSARFKRGEQIVVYVPDKGKAQASRSLASAKKGRVTREAKLDRKVKARKGKTVVASAKKSSSKARAGASSRTARVRVASAR